MSHRYYVIDAFATEKYTGNPAAVVLDANGIDDATMQAIALEFNQGITTFVRVPDAPTGDGTAYRFRWFTPTTEIRVCGHGTIAGVCALLECGRVRHDDPTQSTSLKIDTKAGVLTAFLESIPGQPQRHIVWIDLPEPRWAPPEFDPRSWAAALGAKGDIWDSELPSIRTQDNDVILFVRDFGVLNGLRPDFSAVAALSKNHRIRGVCISTVRTVTSSVHAQSRFFAPSIGIPEDPASGSVHGPLAAYLVDRGIVPMHDGLAGLTCVQGIPGGRTGLLHAIAQRHPDGTYSSRIGGRAVVTMSGTLAP